MSAAKSSDEVKHLDLVRIRKVGDEIMVPLPVSFNIDVNIEYRAVLKEDGVIKLIPGNTNLYDEATGLDVRAAIEKNHVKDNGSLVGRENFWTED
ncbi:hypothetical protein FC50_GL001161 [Lacticaseibacillus pantheris DSM 15945 = JCM 12539 = NBRC 106106]|jgi:hypothetical protein|uniref:Uncharacterized protein n=1 Tax=Lacticaseibacillus pantheris DSM 15945 = JCM 12539 = NBRC 106106 TaxID=1423783 RepID=A0A0R1U2T3_9LACO|nr:hypothetical protein [Lacticaseibacillus pantheris]KRL85770.1 hypothetical protein FC50_GL001161 [Lacticaseibacillus pantheris DSM 15945 = JCM 12539 = NBRC 106106]